jgi:hypothetical protein
MNILKTLSNAFLRASVDSIVAAVDVQIERLEKAAAAHRAHADTQYARMDQLEAKAIAANNEAIRASRIAKRYKTFIS